MSLRVIRVAASLRVGASALALCAAAGAVQAQQVDSAPVAAPPGTNSDASEVVVTGIRSSLANAQAIKRNSDTVVDAVTAQDIGALPDRSVTEALQRVPGVAISRFAGGNDPDHFSVEGSSVVIRGLNFVRSEFNGRDTFSANDGRALTFADVPSELLGSVEVYKNTTASMIEGGLAGTVNLNTRKPFDQKGFHLGFDAEANYGDFRKKWTPVGSVLVSNTWETGAGTFGLLGDISYSRLMSRADAVHVTNFQTRDGGTAEASSGNAILVRNQLPGKDVAYAPIGASARTQDFDRKRFGVALAGQWESVDHRLLLTGQFLRSQATSAWTEHSFETTGELAEYNTYPVGCQQDPAGNTPTAAGCVPGHFTDYQYDDNNVFEKGYITSPGTGWRTADSGSATSKTPTGGTQQVLYDRSVYTKTVTSDYSANLKWEPTDRLHFNFDGQYVKATTYDFDFSSNTSTFAEYEVDLTGKIPQVIQHKPLTLAANWGTPNPRIAGETDQQYFEDKANYFWRSAMDHIEESDGTEWAFKADGTYDVNGDIPFVKNVKFGARYADRDQTVRYSVYNWGAVSEVWSGTSVNLDQSPANTEFFRFTDFMRGKANAPYGGWYYNGDLRKDYQAASEYFKSINDIWHNQNGAAASNRWLPLAERPGVIPGTPFLPGEVSTVSEATKAAYVQLNFGQAEPVFGNVRIDGNIGLRYVATDSRTLGSLSLPPAATFGSGQSFDVYCAPQVPTGAPAGTPPVVPAGVCQLGRDYFNSAQAFGNGASFPSTAENKYHHWLPSLNVKFAVGRDVIVRLAASKVLTRPDMGYIRNYVNIGTDTSSGFRFLATAGNPYLMPATAKEFDAGVEWYFGRVGSLTATAFYKDVKGFFYENVTHRQITNNGVTETVDIRGPDNYHGNGKIYGVEVGYQQTFDFLPGVLSGFGVEGNYTYIKSQGLPNSFLSNVVDGPTSTPPTGRGHLPLEGLSKHNFNLAAFYEKGPISMRAAYSWRSQFLQTATDVIFPYFPIYNASTGQLDASIFLSLNKHIKIGVQGVNLTDEVTKTLAQFTPSGLKGPRSNFINDRRYSFILRGNF